ncbi:MAG TPA: endonuclease/exonuclease/phosphatase family protein [Cyclobacteriaceae bacterium]|nr:endonuclease/exonuclease/phosphatase family protein [Cyclobacteriaceae bacterium]
MFSIKKSNVAILIIGVALPSCLKNIGNPENNFLEIQKCFAYENRDVMFDIITWNVPDFPVNDNEAIERLSAMVTASGADILALQEIEGAEKFSDLLAFLPGYTGFINAASDQNPAFLVGKESRLNIIEARALFEDDPYAFPRPALMISAVNAAGDTMILINLHLKCCDGEVNEARRQAGLDKLKQFVDGHFYNDKLIILGDFNEEITGPGGRSVFHQFLSDSLNFRFADLLLANGPSSGWSYPEWPSHIDHFLISNEWFEDDYSVVCLTPELCDSTYFTTISDHRPLLLRVRL